MKSIGILAAVAFAGTRAVAGQSIATDDYPPLALAKREQGTVAITVTVDTGGHVKDCTVTKSSGFRDLDEATCDKFTKYARFTPAKDDNGNPKEFSYSTKMTWKID